MRHMNYGYDALNRLTSAAPDSGATGYTESYAYNGIGNLTTKNGVTQLYAAQVANCNGVTLTKPHALRQAGSYAYSYDCAGNMTSRTEKPGANEIVYNQTWNTENRLAGVTAGSATTTYTYNGDNQRVRKDQAGQTTVYVGNYYEQNLSTGIVTRYYSIGGRRVAMRQGTTVTYLHGDHLGSTSLTTQINGQEVARQYYTPFGSPRRASGALATDYRFTGQRSEEAQLGSLYDYGARFYSPLIGRFLSADTIVPEPGNPQSLNRYSYCLNNPLRFVDPSGHQVEIPGVPNPYD